MTAEENKKQCFPNYSFGGAAPPPQKRGTKYSIYGIHVNYMCTRLAAIVSVPDGAVGKSRFTLKTIKGRLWRNCWFLSLMHDVFGLVRTFLGREWVRFTQLMTAGRWVWEGIKHSNWTPFRPEKTADADIAVKKKRYSPREEKQQGDKWNSVWVSPTFKPWRGGETGDEERRGVGLLSVRQERAKHLFLFTSCNKQCYWLYL